jgi:transposase
MSRSTRAVDHLLVDVVKAKRQRAANMPQRRRWRIVSNALGDPRPASTIALPTGVSLATVRLGISSYKRVGPRALATPGKGGRRHDYLPVAEEQEFLGPFFERAAVGQLATAGAIQQALEAHLGHAVHASTVYRLLARHGWRNVVPRPTHPQADAAVQAAVKQPSR